MDSKFLLSHTSMGQMPANTMLERVKLYAIKYLFEYFYRLWRCKQHGKQVIDDLLSNQDLRATLVNVLGMAQSNDKLFYYMQIDIPEEVKSTTPPMQLSAYAESVFIEAMRPYYYSLDYYYTVNSALSTIATINTNNDVAVIIESKHFAKYLALLKHFREIVLWSIIQLVALIVIVAFAIHVFTQ